MNENTRAAFDICPNCGGKEHDLDDLFPVEHTDPQEEVWTDVVWCPQCGAIGENKIGGRYHTPIQAKQPS